MPIAQRFRGFLPVVVDVETGGFNPATDALLELAVSIIEMDPDGWLYPAPVQVRHIAPFPGANIEQAALEFNGIRPDHPLRPAVDEETGLRSLLNPVRQALRDTGCKRAVLVGHNAHFDLSFLNAVIARVGYKRNPFHPFSCFDTATLGGLAYGQTVLARAVTAAGLEWNSDRAHSAAYDTERTASLFCTIVNRWRHLQELE
ncbi:MAG: ribonuclease T [Wenzhouxiangella sp.]